jgi:hypothetical protein
MVCSMNCPWLYDGVTTLMRGHAAPPGAAGTIGSSVGMSGMSLGDLPPLRVARR